MMNFLLTCIQSLFFGFVFTTQKRILPSDKVAFLNDFLQQSNEKHVIIEDHMCWDHGKIFKSMTMFHLFAYKLIRQFNDMCN